MKNPLAPGNPPEGFLKERMDPCSAFNPMTGERAQWDVTSNAWLDPATRVPAGYERHLYDPDMAMHIWNGRMARIDPASGHWVDRKSNLRLYPLETSSVDPEAAITTAPQPPPSVSVAAAEPQPAPDTPARQSSLDLRTRIRDLTDEISRMDAVASLAIDLSPSAALMER